MRQPTPAAPPNTTPDSTPAARTTTRRAAEIVGPLAAALALTACSGGPDAAGPSARIAASDFAAKPADRAAAPTHTTPLATPGADAPTPARRTSAARQPADVIAIPGPPALAAPSPSSPPTARLDSDRASIAPSPAPAPAERTLVIDEMVGQVNGKPIYAAEFFAPLDARLRAELEQKPAREWARDAAEVIGQRLNDLVRNELVLAEFNTSLSPEERTGILAFLEGLRADIVSGNLGSAALAEQRLLDEEGLTLDQKVEELSEEIFIREHIRREIENKVNVSFRDVQRHYERNADEYRGSTTVTLRLLRLTPDRDAGDTDAERQAELDQRRDTIQAAIDRGADFAELAREHSAFRPADGGREVVEIPGDDLADATFVGLEPVNDAIRALDEGDVAGPIDAAGSLFWVRLEDVDRVEGPTLFDVQEDIERALARQRMRELEQEYVQDLFERANFTDQGLMHRRLMRFALRRYLDLTDAQIDDAMQGRF